MYCKVRKHVTNQTTFRLKNSLLHERSHNTSITISRLRSVRLKMTIRILLAATCLVTVVLLGRNGAAFAQAGQATSSQLSGRAAVDPSSPVTLDSCSGSKSHTTSASNIVLASTITFTNNSSKTISGAKFAYYPVDSTGGGMEIFGVGGVSLVANTRIYTGMVRAGDSATTTGHGALDPWMDNAAHFKTIGSIVCTVERVGFQDGSTWDNPHRLSIFTPYENLSATIGADRTTSAKISSLILDIAWQPKQFVNYYRAKLSLDNVGSQNIIGLSYKITFFDAGNVEVVDSSNLVAVSAPPGSTQSLDVLDSIRRPYYMRKPDHAVLTLQQISLADGSNESIH